MTTKTYNNSREGNDCWVYEYWYWCEPLRAAVRVSRVSGWSDTDTTAIAFTKPDDTMPDEVQAWFKEGKE